MRFALGMLTACVAVGTGVSAAVQWQRTAPGLTHNGTTSDAVSIRGNAVLTLLGGVPVLYDAAAGKELARFNGLRDPVYGMSLSPDGRRVITTTSNGNPDYIAQPLRNDMQMWDAASGRMLWQISTARVWHPEWSPDSRNVLFTAEKETAVWDAVTGLKRAGYDGEAHFDNAGRTLAVIRGGNVRLLDASSQQQRCEIDAGSGAYIQSPVFSPDGSIFAAIVRFPQAAANPDYEARRDLRVWRTATCADLHSFSIPANGFTEVSFAADGQGLLLNLSRPAVAEIVGVRTGEVLRSFQPSPADFVKDAQLSGDGRHVLLRTSFYKGRDRESCSLWDVDAGRELHRWEENYDGQGCAGFTGDSRNVIVLEKQRSIQLWSAATGKIVRDSAAAAH